MLDSIQRYNIKKCSTKGTKLEDEYTTHIYGGKEHPTEKQWGVSEIMSQSNKPFIYGTATNLASRMHTLFVG